MTMECSSDETYASKESYNVIKTKTRYKKRFIVHNLDGDTIIDTSKCVYFRTLKELFAPTRTLLGGGGCGTLNIAPGCLSFLEI